MSIIRIATYNIHKCVGLDRKYRPERIAEVLREIDADIIALQEVSNNSLTVEIGRQAEFISKTLLMDFRLGHNRFINGGEYGNAVLSRLPIKDHKNYDISVKRYERRGCLWAGIEIGSSELQFLNVHFGTSFFERRLQVKKLLADEALGSSLLSGKCIIAGDFNEWTNGLTTKLLRKQFKSVEPKLHLGKSRTYPGILPLFHLDNIYFDRAFSLQRAWLHRSRKSLIASDHLPIVAEFLVNSK